MNSDSSSDNYHANSGDVPRQPVALPPTPVDLPPVSMPPLVPGNEPPKRSSKLALWIVLGVFIALLVAGGAGFALYTYTTQSVQPASQAKEEDQSKSDNQSDVPESDVTPVEGSISPLAFQPSPGTTDPKDAAAQLIRINYELVKAKSYQAACSIHSAAHIEGLAYRAGLKEKDCPSILEQAYKQSDDYLALAKKNNFLAIVPYFYIPSSITVNKDLMEVDSDTLVYVSWDVIKSTDPTVFGKTADHDTPVDDSDRTPGWLTESFYVKKDSAGIWRFIRSIEK